MSLASIPTTPDDLTADWLTTALREGGVLVDATVVTLTSTIIGLEFGFTGIVSRVALEYDRLEPDAPATIVAKFPNAAGESLSTYRETQQRDPAAARRYAERCAREIWFYQQVAPLGITPAPRMYYGVADLDQGRFVLLLEDLAGMRMGDALAGCSAEDAAAVLGAIGVFHSGWWTHPTIADFPWIAQWRGGVDARQARYSQHVDPFLARYGDRIPETVRQIVCDLRPVYRDIVSELAAAPATLIHADLHLDNIAFDDLGVASVIDWQGIIAGPAVVDLAGFLPGALDPARVMAGHDEFLRAYHGTLVANGVHGYSVEQLLHDYRLALLCMLAGNVNWLASVDRDSLAGRELALTDAVIDKGWLFSALIDSNAGELLVRSSR